MVADDHPIFRKGLIEIIALDDRFEIVGEAACGAVAWDLFQKQRPDLALLDIDMPELNGLDLATRIFQSNPDAGVVILTTYKDENLFNSAMDRGVKAYVLKENAINDVINALLAVSRGEVFLSPSISSFLLKRARRIESIRSSQTGINQLTPMELRVLRLVANDLTSKEIGKKLFISPRTVDTHRNNICIKLDLHGSHGLLIFAVEKKQELRSLKMFPEDFGD